MPGTSVKLYGRRKEEAAVAGEDARLEALAGEDEGYDEYIPLKERRRREAERRAGKLGKNRREMERARLEQEREEDERMASKRAAAAISSAAGDGEGGGEDAAEAAAGPGAEGSKKPRTLLEAAKELKKATANLDAGTIKQMRAKEEEHRMLKEANQVQTNALMSAAEVAKGTRYTEALTTSWRPPKYYRDMTEEDCDKLREKWSILVDGEKVPPPIKSFREMKLPDPMLAALEAKGIKRPTPIQVQGVPVALSGRDMIGIAFTGSGKTVTFSIPLIMLALEEEMKLPVVGGEGPFGVILCPSRELARQTFDVVDYFCKHLHRGGFPELRTVLCIGGEDKRSQIDPIQRQGVHCIVATPGRISDLLHTHKVHFDLCKYICLDEGDRMLDMGFDEEVQKIMNHFKQQRQTLLFSATMPQKFQDFAKDVLVKPVLVNVGRAGAANLDVIQEVEYVKQEAKIVYLLECLQKTAPPVCIFCEKKQDVDDIHEYLLLKGVDAVSIHGGKEQEERNEAIKLFKEGVKDVLIATDIAAKGLDFPDIQHVINFDMPDEIENYVHRIGRTGRCGKTGVATTFINKASSGTGYMVEESALLDLKHLLMEAQQRVPPVLMALEDPDQEMDEVDGVKGCAFCGGLGHRITNCPKIDKTASQKAGAQRDVLADTGGYGGDW
ncbi:unnamed protein product [Ectocarpus sp. 12 AP-2014]